MREAETERERGAVRLASLEAALQAEQERAVHATQAAAVQVRLGMGTLKLGSQAKRTGQAHCDHQRGVKSVTA